MEPSNNEARGLLNSLFMDKLTEDLLFENGKSDCENGIDKDTGWAEVAKLCGYPQYARTPAQEKYLDGYYSTTFNKNKKEVVH